MAVLWATGKLKSWVSDTKRQVKDQGMAPLMKLHERFSDIHDSTRARIGSEVATRALALGRQLIKAEVHEVQIKDGPISYWKTNNGHPETVLFIHGFGDSKDGCYPFAMHLTRHFNMMAFDLPGFGSSFKNPELEYNFDSYARWMVEFMEAIDSKPVHLVGNSLGGAMAMKLAEVRPDLVKTLTLIDTAAVIDNRYESAYDDFIKGKVLFQIKTREDFDAFWKRVFNKPPFMPIFMKDYIFEQFRSNYDLYGRFILDTFRGISSRVDPGLNDLFMNNALQKMKMPIHFIWGEKDTLFPVTYGIHAHGLVKDSELTIMKNIGHAPQVEAPHMTAKHVKRFIDRHPDAKVAKAPNQAKKEFEIELAANSVKPTEDLVAKPKRQATKVGSKATAPAKEKIAKAAKSKAVTKKSSKTTGKTKSKAK